MSFAREMVGSEENIDVILVEYFINVFVHVFNCVLYQKSIVRFDKF